MSETLTAEYNGNNGYEITLPTLRGRMVKKGESLSAPADLPLESLRSLVDQGLFVAQAKPATKAKNAPTPDPLDL